MRLPLEIVEILKIHHLFHRFRQYENSTYFFVLVPLSSFRRLVLYDPLFRHYPESHLHVSTTRFKQCSAFRRAPMNERRPVYSQSSRRYIGGAAPPSSSRGPLSIIHAAIADNSASGPDKSSDLTTVSVTKLNSRPLAIVHLVSVSPGAAPGAPLYTRRCGAESYYGTN